MENASIKLIAGLLVFSFMGAFGELGLFIFFGTLLFGLICLFCKWFSGDQRHPPSGNQLKQNVNERIELKNKYQSKIPQRTPDGKLYTNAMQIYDKTGIYSPEYYQEWKELTNKQRAREGKPPLYEFKKQQSQQNCE